jgi:hypothetical protein
MGTTVFFFLGGLKIFWWKTKCETMRRRKVTASSFVANIRGEVFAHFQAVIIKRHSSMRNWLFGLPGRILCEQSPWWTWFWLCSLPVSPFSICPEQSMLYKRPCAAYTFFPEHLSNQCQSLRRTFAEICTKFDAYSLSDPSRNRIMPDARLQIKGHEKSARPPKCLKCCALTPKIC